jgi:synaptojanin
MGKDLNLFFISRRRHEMAGTRFNARGLDEEGNTANFVETEVVFEFPDQNLIFSHV